MVFLSSYAVRSLSLWARVGLGAFSRLFFYGLFQRLETPFFSGIEFQLHLLDVEQLLFKLLAAFGDFGQHAVELLLVAAGGVR